MSIGARISRSITASASLRRSNPGLFVGLGPLARDYILEAGGTGYFRMGAVRSYLENGRLHRVHDAPEFSYPGYAVYGTNGDEAVLRPARKGSARWLPQNSRRSDCGIFRDVTSHFEERRKPERQQGTRASGRWRRASIVTAGLRSPKAPAFQACARAAGRGHSTYRHRGLQRRRRAPSPGLASKHNIDGWRRRHRPA